MRSSLPCAFVQLLPPRAATHLRIPVALSASLCAPAAEVFLPIRSPSGSFPALCLAPDRVAVAVPMCGWAVATALGHSHTVGVGESGHELGNCSYNSLAEQGTEHNGQRVPPATGHGPRAAQTPGTGETGAESPEPRTGRHHHLPTRPCTRACSPDRPPRRASRMLEIQPLSSACIGEPEVSHSVLFPTFLQPLSNALRVFKRDKPRERWRPVGRPPLALSSQLEANGLAFGGAVFDKPLATVVEQRPLQRPTPPRQQVQRRRWCCPELGWSTASAIFSSWCAKSGGAACLERVGGRMIAMPARWLHRSSGPPWSFRRG